MSFGSPFLLLFLLVLPLALGAYVWLERRRSAGAAAWASPALLSNMVAAPGRWRMLPAVLFMLGAALLLVGFARPEAKFSQVKPGATIVLAVDDSGSMAANDVPPTRLSYADAVLTRFAETLPPSYRLALVDFSIDYSVRVPPTYNRAELIAALPHTAQLEGSAIGDAVGEAVKVAKRAQGPASTGSRLPPAAVLVLSDGGQNAGKLTLAQAAAAAKKAGIPISTLALGTPGGSVTQRVTVSGSTQKFTEVTKVPAEPGNLKQLAVSSGGIFFQNASSEQLAAVYKALGPRLVHDRSLREITIALSAAALVLIVAGAVLSGLWFRRLV